MKTLDALTEPLAITMWDSSWIRRRYRGGGFEDWDKALSELTERGYNAVRIDAFPHLIAPSSSGEVVEVFKDVPNQFPHFYGFATWGNPWTMYIEPRKALIEFLTKCREHGVKVGLSTWFKPTDDRRNERIEGIDEFVRIWDYTLQLIDDHGLMDTIVYLDVLNEYPMSFVFTWFHQMMGTLARPAAEPGRLTPRQRVFAEEFINETLSRLRRRWPDLSMATSMTLHNFRGHLAGMDLSEFDFLDVHIWLNQCVEYEEGTQYADTIFLHGSPHNLFTRDRSGGMYSGQSERLIPADYHYDELYTGLLEKWRSRKTEWVAWYEEAIGSVAEAARRYDAHLGQTEAWGLVNWAEHPLLEWDIHRETAEVCAEIAAREGYLFNCSANFCHPQFIGFWEDVEWHRKVTATIRGVA